MQHVSCGSPIFCCAYFYGWRLDSRNYGELMQGITHTRAIELIQAGGTKVLLLLRPGTGLIPDHEYRALSLYCQLKVEDKT
ncbi:membrane-associated guanylate kinase, WW and PDZ domain-containing protein 3-like [Pseudophryne corroboree]|uniref:membrane-associated guanylate kinase, WW and PDZ domain-containing protein 3-like n=1 Tax=Pseudophryne corroboree TaxID=495146 RepID=UPI00308182C4